MATVTEKRKKIIFNGTVWVEVYSPTTSDLVYVDGSGTTLATKLTTMDSSVSTHVADTDLHLSLANRTKLGNLTTDANNTYASKTELTDHTGNTDVHVSTAQASKLTNLADDANSTYATKVEISGKKDTFYAADIAARDVIGAGLGTDDNGDLCWVRDASADTTNVTENQGAAAYMWDGTTWQFLLQSAEITLVEDWADITNKPTSTVAAIDAAVTNSHTHTNKTVIDALTEDADGELAYKGEKVHKPSNRIFLNAADDEPADPMFGDMWYPEIVEP